MRIFQKVFLAVILMFMVDVIWANPEEFVIRMTKNGFEPNQVSTPKDVTVKFLNDDIVNRWPASDVHPTHTIYSQFDPKKPIKPGQVWEFKFLRSGSFKYHDHLAPHFKGVITIGNGQVLGETYNIWKAILERVISLLNEIKDAFSKKISSPPDIQTFKNLSQNEQYDVLKKISQPFAAWSYVKKAYENEQGDRGVAHDLAHFVGSLIYEAKGFDGIKICNPNFAFGCYHGFLDQAFAKNLDRIPDAEQSCSKIGNAGPVASCIHGIGHGVASFYKTSDLNSALKACQGLNMGQSYCFDGVFMEFQRNAVSNFYNSTDPLYPCNSIDQKYVFSCGRNQPRVMMDRLGLSYEQVVHACSQAKNIDLQNACFDALGFSAVAQSAGNTGSILALCSKIPLNQGKIRCIKSAAGEVIFQEIKGWHDSSTFLCQSLSQNAQKDCLDYIEVIKRDYNRICSVQGPGVEPG